MYKVAEALFQDRMVLGFRAIERATRRKLLYLHNRLEALKGHWSGQHSIRINDQWTICFVRRDGRTVSMASYTAGAVTADTALRPATYFGVAPEIWLNLQSEYDLRVTRRARGDEIAKTVRKRQAA